MLNQHPKYYEESIKLGQSTETHDKNIGVGEFWEWIDQDFPSL